MSDITIRQMSSAVYDGETNTGMMFGSISPLTCLFTNLSRAFSELFTCKPMSPTSVAKTTSIPSLSSFGVAFLTSLSQEILFSHGYSSLNAATTLLSLFTPSHRSEEHTSELHSQ